MVYASGLDVDGGDFGVVVCGEDGELDGPSPRRWFEDVLDVSFSWHAENG